MGQQEALARVHKLQKQREEQAKALKRLSPKR
jgi:hypothetical protein